MGDMDTLVNFVRCMHSAPFTKILRNMNTELTRKWHSLGYGNMAILENLMHDTVGIQKLIN